MGWKLSRRRQRSPGKNKWIGKYFVGENGKWIKKFKGGWYKINKKWYYYTKEGVKKTGWLKYKGNKYYLDKNGVRLTKWQKIKNTTYYFTKKGKQRSTSWKRKAAGITRPARPARCTKASV